MERSCTASLRSYPIQIIVGTETPLKPRNETGTPSRRHLRVPPCRVFRHRHWSWLRYAGGGIQRAYPCTTFGARQHSYAPGLIVIRLQQAFIPNRKASWYDNRLPLLLPFCGMPPPSFIGVRGIGPAIAIGISCSFPSSRCHLHRCPQPARRRRFSIRHIVQVEEWCPPVTCILVVDVQHCERSPAKLARPPRRQSPANPL